MSEDTRFQPFDGRAAAHNASPFDERHPIASTSAGFLCAGVLATVCVFFCVAPNVPAIAIIGGGASGPVAGLLLWWMSRDSLHCFSLGALVFGIVCFIMGGACMAVWGLS